MKTVTYVFMKGMPYGAFMIKSEQFDLVSNKLEKEVWRKDIHNDYHDTEQNYILARPWAYRKDFEQIVVEQMSILVQEGFELTDKAKQQYEYWGKRYAETKAREEERERARRLKELEKELKAKEMAQFKYIQWCEKYDCMTNTKTCNKCEKGFRMGCKPSLMKVKVC